MKSFLLLLTLGIGIVLTVHLAMNGNVGSILKNPRMGNALFWVIGAITALAIAFTGWDGEFFLKIKEVPLWLLSAGILGGALVFGVAWVMPQLGAGPVMIIMIFGQVTAGLVLSHFGWLGSPVEKMDWLKFVGVIVMICGVLLTTYSDKILSKN
jgi:bacterial/archaeal transporter family-2 protein